MGLKPVILVALALAVLPASRAMAVGPQADRMILDGLDALYGLDFALAENRFQAADQLESTSPAGPFFLSGLYWLQYSQNVDLPGSGASLEPRFEKEIDRAILRAEALIKKNPKNAEAYFFYGAAYGMRGRWQILKHQWIRAALSGCKGYKFLQKAVALDPNYEDAYLGLGMYDYYSATLPAALKFASLLVVRGDKKRGLKYVQETIEKGHYSKTEARIFLIGVDTAYEHQPALAVSLAQDLRKEKPDNPFFTLLEIITRMAAKDWDGAVPIAEALSPAVRQLPYAAPQTSIFDLYLGEAYMGRKDWDKAKTVFERCILEAPDLRKGAVTYCRLRLAQTNDLMGQRTEAVKGYLDVNGQPEIADSREKAKLGLKKPADYKLVETQLTE